jgi:AHBA synthesis associated protein
VSRRAVIFDLDGVLIDSWRVAERALTLALASNGYVGAVPINGFKNHLGKPLQVILQELGLPEGVEATFNRHALDLTHEVSAFQGIAEMLASLRSAYLAVGVGTCKSRQRACAALDHTKLSTLIDALVTPDDAPGKPDPRALRQCLMALSASEAMCFVGDTAVDSRVARAAGIPAAFAAWGYTTDPLSADWDIRFDAPQDVLHWALHDR